MTCPQPKGACCLPNGSCVENKTAAECSGLGGTYQGDGSVCANVTCPQPRGACCLPNGSCVENKTAAECSGLGGTYQGDNSVCANVSCPQPRGACCLPNGSCVENKTAAECSGLGGTYQGDNSVCANVTCPAPCALELDLSCEVQTTPSSGTACEAKIRAMLLRYIGPSMTNATVVFQGSTGAIATYSNVNLVSGITVLSGASENGYTIDATVDGLGDLGSKTDILINGQGVINGVIQKIHTSCSTPFVAGAPAPLDNPKGNPSPNWFVLGFIDKNGRVVSVPQPQDPSSDCEVNLPPPPSCETTGTPNQITWRYTGGGCAATSHQQAPGKSFCSGTVNGNLPAMIIPTGVASFVVNPGDEFTISRDASKWIKLKNAGGTEQNDIHVSCSQPLRVGDVYGSLTLVAMDGRRGGADVKFRYRVTNTGLVDVMNVTVVDDIFGPVAGSPIPLIPVGESRTLMMNETLTQTTTHSATATGMTASTVCNATDSSTVTVLLPPPPPPPQCIVIAEDELDIDDKVVEWELKNLGSNTITIRKITITWPNQNGKLRKVKLEGKQIFGQERSPTTTVIDSNWSGALKDRQIKAGKEAELKLEFKNNARTHQSGYVITIEFEEGCSISFPVSGSSRDILLTAPDEDELPAIENVINGGSCGAGAGAAGLASMLPVTLLGMSLARRRRSRRTGRRG